MVLDACESATVVRPPPWRLFKVALLLVFLSLAARELNLNSWNAGGVTILWPTNGFLLGILLTEPKRNWTTYLGIGYLIDLAFNLLAGTPIPGSAYLAGCNAGEVLLAAILLYPYIASKPDLTERRQF